MEAGVRIVFTDLAKRYDLRVVFKGVSGEAVPGSVLVLTGANGSGKSTLLALLCGLIRPTRGTVRFLVGEGREIPRSHWHRFLGVVAPAMSLYEELDALENLQFFSSLRPSAVAAREDRDAHCRLTLRSVGLDPGRTTLVRGFSTGMLQRLKIAQAILHDPPLLLLDEPGSNLDPAGQDWLEAWVRQRAATGKTIVLATNDRREMTWGDHRVELPG